MRWGVEWEDGALTLKWRKNLSNNGMVLCKCNGPEVLAECPSKHTMKKKKKKKKRKTTFESFYWSQKDKLMTWNKKLGKTTTPGSQPWSHQPQAEGAQHTTTLIVHLCLRTGRWSLNSLWPLMSAQRVVIHPGGPQHMFPS